MTFDSGHDMPGGSANPDTRVGIVKRFAFCAVLIAVAVSADVVTSMWGARERVLLAISVALAVIVGVLLKRHRLSDQRLAAERRQLSVAVNNIPQGLVLYDSSARIIICNQPYIEMFGLSPDVAKPGCTMQRLIEHRKETGS
jgi:PAS domain-containing protein